MIKYVHQFMKGEKFDGIERIGALNFLNRFQDAGDMKNVHEGLEKWIFKSFLNGDLLKKVDGSLMESKRNHKDGVKNALKDKKEQLYTYSDVVNYLLWTYDTDQTIFEADRSVRDLRQKDRQGLAIFANDLTTLANLCGQVYSEDTVMNIYCNNPFANLGDRTKKYLIENPEVDLSALDEHAQAIRALR